MTRLPPAARTLPIASRRARQSSLFLRAAGLLLPLLLVGCHGVTYRVAGKANDYAYLFARAARVCGPAITHLSPACHAANIALTDYRGTLDLADDAVQRKGPLKMTEAQLKADRAAALKAVAVLGVIP
jgi:hypothetical protein